MIRESHIVPKNNTFNFNYLYNTHFRIFPNCGKYFFREEKDKDLKRLKSSAVVGMSIKLPTIRQAPLLVLLTNNRSVNHMGVGIRFYFYYLRIMEQLPVYLPPFFTATILEWNPLLKLDKYKEIIIRSLQYLTANKQITLYAFVIMNNHIHLIWQALPGKTPEQVQHSFMKYTAQQIKFDLV